jgi:hypothetical protein
VEKFSTRWATTSFSRRSLLYVVLFSTNKNTFHLKIRYGCVFLTEQWACNTDSRVDMPSCQLASLGPMSDAVVDEINQCILFEGPEDGSEMRVAASMHEDVTPVACIRSVALRRFGVDATRGTGTQFIKRGASQIKVCRYWVLATTLNNIYRQSAMWVRWYVPIWGSD